jgi:peroxiredoxin Q/BCP
MPLTLGQAAPTFSLADGTGRAHTLNEYAGRWVVLYFYPADDTPGCTAEACQFRDFHAEISEKAVILGVSSDSGESHQQFVAKYKLPFPLLVDEGSAVAKAYGADGLIFNKRVTYLIDPQGKIAKMYTQVTPETHAREVLVDLKALQSA